MTEPASQAVLARFNPLIQRYLLIYVGLMLTVTVVLIPLAVVWFLGLGQWWARRYFDKLECELDDSALRFRVGIMFSVEKTIPLENIQDVTFVEGPLLKRFNLSILKFETAGQSAGQAADMRLIGVIDAHDFRAEILRRREALKDRESARDVRDASKQDESLVVLRSILERLDEIAVHIRNKA